MTRSQLFWWAGANLLAGLALTFLAPKFSEQVAQPIAIAYLLLVGITQFVLQLRSAIARNFRLIAFALTPLLVGVLLVILPFDHSDQVYHQVISHWAAIQALLLFLTAKQMSFRSARGRDLLVVAVASAALATLLYIPASALRDILGYFSAYLLVSGVFLAIAAFSEQK